MGIYSYVMQCVYCDGGGCGESLEGTVEEMGKMLEDNEWVYVAGKHYCKGCSSVVYDPIKEQVTVCGVRVCNDEYLGADYER